MAQSYNGWPADPNSSAIGINTSFTVLGTKPFGSGGYAGGIKGGDVETVFKYLITRLHQEVEPMMSEGSNLGYGCWGYSYRANVNNPSQLSCHASGTAIDYNAPKHANGTSTGPNGGGGWSGSQYQAVQAILGTIGVVSWLTGNDPMHFEIQGSTSQVASAAQKLGSSTPGPTPVPPPEEQEDPDMYHTFQLDTGGGLYVAAPGVFEGIPSQEYYNALVNKGAAKPVVRVSQRDLDVLRDSYRRWPKL